MKLDYGFTVRVSGKRADSYYVDFMGYYTVADVAKMAGINQIDIKLIYADFEAIFDTENNVYYFNSLDKAQKAVEKLITNMPKDRRGRAVYLTEAEVEYIRKALINENNNTIHVSSKIKDQLFMKLNG